MRHMVASVAAGFFLVACRGTDAWMGRPEFASTGAAASFSGTVTRAGGTFVTTDGRAGVSIPANALPAGVDQVELFIEPIAADLYETGRGPLPTALGQYPPFYHFRTVPAVQFIQAVVVGICGDPRAIPWAHRDSEFRLAHTVGDNTVEITQLVVRPSFLNCTRTGSLGQSPSSWKARLVVFVQNLSLVRQLHAATTTSVACSGMGGMTSSFSPFAIVHVPW